MAEKAKITAGSAKLEVYKDRGFYRINTLNFRPSEYPAFTKFLEQSFTLEQVHSGVNESGFYLVKVDPNKREEFLNLLSDELGNTVDNKSPCIYTGTKR